VTQVAGTERSQIVTGLQGCFSKRLLLGFTGEKIDNTTHLLSKLVG
jgi:hypothetical protein